MKLTRDGVAVATVRQLEINEGRCSFIAVGALLSAGDAVYELVDGTGGAGRVRRLKIIAVETSSATSSCVVTGQLITSP